MELLKNILKSTNNFLQHKRGNVPELVLLKCTVLYERSHFRKETAPVALRAATCVQNRKILRPIGPSTNFLSPIARFFAKVIRRDSEASP